jgi:hypothetical protein
MAPLKKTLKKCYRKHESVALVDERRGLDAANNVSELTIDK